MSQIELWKKNWDPFSPRSLGRFFDDFYTPALANKADRVAVSPNVEVHESKNKYSMKFDLPGLTKDQIKIDLHDNVLTVSGERRDEKSEEDKERKTYLSEVSYGSFMRSFTFPEGIDAETSAAKFENGVLTLDIPKKETAAKRQITIK